MFWVYQIKSKTKQNQNNEENEGFSPPSTVLLGQPFAAQSFVAAVVLGQDSLAASSSAEFIFHSWMLHLSPRNGALVQLSPHALGLLACHPSQAQVPIPSSLQLSYALHYCKFSLQPCLIH